MQNYPDIANLYLMVSFMSPVIVWSCHGAGTWVGHGFVHQVAHGVSFVVGHEVSHAVSRGIGNEVGPGQVSQLVNLSNHKSLVEDGEHEQVLSRSSTSLYYISLSLGFGNIDDRHRHPNINIREIILLGSRPLLKCKHFII